MSRILLFLIALALPAAATAAPPNYEEHIKPLFRAHCLKCHNADEANADLNLASYAAVLKGGSSGEVVKPGRPESSQLYRAMAHLDGAEAMPPESPKLGEEKIALVREWIRGGLIPGKGGKSMLRSVGELLAVKPGVASPMPASIPATPLSVTTRPPIPQALATSPGAKLFAVSGQEQVLLFGTPTGGTENDAPSNGEYTFLGALPFPEGTIHDLKFSRNGTLLMAAGGRGASLGRVVLFDVKIGKRAAEIGDEVDSVLAADVTSNHRFVALGGPGRLVKIFRTDTGEAVHKIKKHTDWVTAVAFSPNGKLLATGDRSGGIHVWETNNGAIVFSLSEHKVRVTDLAWRSDSTILASGSDDGTVILWSLKDGFPVRNIVAHSQKSSPRYSRRTGVLDVNFAHDGRFLTTGRDASTRLWSPDGQSVLKLSEPALPVSPSLLAGGEQAVVGRFDGTLSIYDLKTKKLQQTLSTASDRAVVSGKDKP